MKGVRQSQENTRSEDTTVGHVARGGCVNYADGCLRVEFLPNLTSPIQNSGLALRDGH